jgi:adenine deaminase
MSKQQAQLIAVARGLAPADLLFTNARIINVFTGEIDNGNVAISGGRIAGIGDYHSATEILDLKDRFLCPGFIDGHVHLESSMLDAGEYVRAVVPRGTLAIVTDLHEIANVSGLAGIRYILDSIRNLPLELFLMAPSCVPATPLESSGAIIGVDEIRQIFRWKECIGLGEMMNYPGIINADETVLKKIGIASRKIIDGHAPSLSGNELNSYLSAGILSDHESVSLKEAAEKLQKGMHVMIREGSSEKNLDALLPLVTDKTWHRCMLVVDDRSGADILKDGDMDAVVRKAISRGLDPVRAVQMATINPAEYFRLSGLGAVAPGYLANVLVLDSLDDLKISQVYYRGKKVASEGQPLFKLKKYENDVLRHTVNIKSYNENSFQLRSSGQTIPIIEAIPGQIVNKKRWEKVTVRDGLVVADISRDILKLVVAERHKATGNIGVGLVSGFGLQTGALASSVAHDSHNIIVVGVDDCDIYQAVKEVERMQGGLVAVAGGKVLASLALPIAGLLSPNPLEQVVSGIQKLDQAARDLGVRIPAPFSVLSFLALPVIPEMRLSDLGLVDVNEFRIIA